MSVAVVIVNFNAGDHLQRCVDSVETELRDVEWTGTLVDNASKDGSVDQLRIGRFVLIRNNRNLGFGAAVNQAARDIAADLIWLLNPDCRVQSDAYRTLVGVLERHPQCAIAAPQLLNADGSTQESARGEPSALTGLFGRHGLLARIFPKSQGARRNLRAREIVASAQASAEVDWVMGASMLIRTDVFRRVGGFDERFFLYWEDADLCRRVRTIGYSVRYVPAARVEHVGAESSRTARRLAIFAFHRSAYLYYATHTVPFRWHPARALAWIALMLRAWWRTTASRP